MKTHIVDKLIEDMLEKDRDDLLITGLMVFYPNVRDVSNGKLNEYLLKVSDDNLHLVETFRQQGYESIWLPYRGDGATHMEVWPFASSKDKTISLKVDVRWVYKSVWGTFRRHVEERFIKTHECLISNIQKQGFKFSTDCCRNRTHIVVY